MVSLTLYAPYEGKTELLCQMSDVGRFRAEMWDTISASGQKCGTPLAPSLKAAF